MWVQKIELLIFPQKTHIMGMQGREPKTGFKKLNFNAFSALKKSVPLKQDLKKNELQMLYFKGVSRFFSLISFREQKMASILQLQISNLNYLHLFFSLMADCLNPISHFFCQRFLTV